MSIKFNNVQLLGLEASNNQLIKDETLSQRKTIEITGLLLDLQNTEGVENIFNEYIRMSEQESQNATEDYSIINVHQDIYINDINYGIGFVQSFSLSGEFIRSAKYTAVVVIDSGANPSEIEISLNDESQTLKLEDLNLTSEDLKNLEEISESFSFNESSKSLIIDHTISCKFKRRKSLIPYRNNIWENANINQNEIENLRGKGKGAIMVAAGGSGVFKVELEAGIYVIEFDYLGQDTNSDLETCSIEAEGQIETLEATGRKKLEFEVASLKEVEIKINASVSNQTYYDNFFLSLKEHLPFYKSIDLTDRIFQTNTLYPIISNVYTGQYKDFINFKNFNKEESFDYISNKYSVSKRLEISELDNLKKYNVKTESSISLDQYGFIEISEESELKNVHSEDEQELRQFVDEFISESKARASSKFDMISSQWFFGCETPTTTRTIFDLFEEPLSLAINYNFGNNSASISIKYSNNKNQKNVGGFKFISETTVSIEDLNGYQNITITGTGRGYGDDVQERNNNSKKAVENITSNIPNLITDVSSSYSYTNTFKELSKEISFDGLTGHADFTIVYSNQKGLDMPSAAIDSVVKKYEITVSTEESTRQAVSFFLNCSTLMQRLGVLHSPKNENIQIQIFGEKNASFSDLKSAANLILDDKNLLTGEDSSRNIFLVNKSYQFDFTQKVLQYSRQVINLEECIIPTDIPDSRFGFDFNLGNFKPTPTISEISFEEEFSIAYTPDTSVSEYEWNFDYEFYTPYPTLTKTQSQTPSYTYSPTYTYTETSTFIETPTLTETANPKETHIVYVPENWNNTLSALFPNGKILYGKKCWDDGGSPFTDSDATFTISESWASQNIVKDCVKSGSGVPFNYFVFESDVGVSPPDNGASRCNYHIVNIPNFWNEPIKELVQESISQDNFIGGYRFVGSFEYAHKQSTYDIDTNLSRQSENNSSHPDQSGTEFFAGPMVFESCTDLNPQDNGVKLLNIPSDGQEISINQRSINAFGDPSSTGCYNLIGFQNCNFINNFNNDLYSKDDVIESCELDFASNDTLNQLYVYYLNDCPTPTPTLTSTPTLTNTPT